LLQPLGRKRAFLRVFGLALCTTFVLYSSLGIATASFFGSDTRPSCNLNWRLYRVRWVAYAIALFPAIDTFTVFPLNVLFLANNVMSSVLGKKWYQEDVPRSYRVVARVVCFLPALACAYFLPSLSRAIDLTGVIGIVLPFVVTPLLHYASWRRLCEHFEPDVIRATERDGGFQTPFSSHVAVFAFGVVGSAVLVYCIISQFW